ncbi:hypothetical protein EHS25_005899 [Saitozyma podzolica]|uniref:NADP-dependent oxidoreductase domain-containing protein n=1 Tax=Saitozyma podzolica TaxID=1890683 RepID=A0A427XVK0_9TREE|nr:hypothetical protein EHS25_005899 [Saitozyma podzolica]
MAAPNNRDAAITLNSGVQASPLQRSLGSSAWICAHPDRQIPQLGFGVYRSPPEITSRTVLAALDAGYRHIDSAQWYFNEEQVGSAIQSSSYPRSSVFLTTKLGHADRIMERLEEGVAMIDPRPDGYVDLYTRADGGAGEEAARRNDWGIKLVRPHREDDLSGTHVEMEGYSRIPLVINQIELHPWCQQPAIVSYCQARNIALEAYSPLVQGKKASDPTLTKIAKETGKTWAQVLIRWSLQRGFIPLPKSDSRDRIIANIDVFDFQLTVGQMLALNALDKDEHVCLNPTECP